VGGLSDLALFVGVAAAFAGLPVLLWRVLLWAAGFISRPRQDALARSFVVVALAATVGACERSQILWGPYPVSGGLPAIVALFLGTLFFSWLNRPPRRAQLGPYVALVIMALLVLPLLGESGQKSVIAWSAVYKSNLLLLNRAIGQYRADKGDFPPSLGVLIATGYLGKDALSVSTQGPWVVYWPPSDNTPPDAAVAFYWPPDHVGPLQVPVAVLLRDGNAISVALRDDGSLVNPRTGEVLMPAETLAGRGGP
jgi:hypothetical protein